MAHHQSAGDAYVIVVPLLAALATTGVLEAFITGVVVTLERLARRAITACVTALDRAHPAVRRVSATTPGGGVTSAVAPIVPAAPIALVIAYDDDTWAPSLELVHDALAER